MNKAEKLKNNREKAILEVEILLKVFKKVFTSIDAFQVTAGVREYFNVMLSSQLLYRQERQQYDQLVKQVVLENKIQRNARDAKCQIIQNNPNQISDRNIWDILQL